jgi:hypothetical protein
MSLSEDSSGKVSLTVLGDPIIGQALVLLLRNCGYEAKFLTALPLRRPLPLKDSGSSLLLLTPTPQLNLEERQAFLSSLKATLKTAPIPVLGLRVYEEETQEESATRDDSWYYVPWPCRIEKLEQCIEAFISYYYGELEAKDLGALLECPSEYHQQSLAALLAKFR